MRNFIIRFFIYLACVFFIFSLFTLFFDKNVVDEDFQQQYVESPKEPQKEIQKEKSQVYYSQNQKILNEKFPKNYIERTLNNGNVIRWNPETFPLKVYIENSSELPQYFYEQVKSAFQEWQAASGKFFAFKYVNSPNGADIRCFFPKDFESEKFEDHATAGLTRMFYENGKIKYADITISAKNQRGELYKEENIFGIAVHEIGHALGIHGHSLNKEDAMYPVISTGKISEGDLNTLKLLYSIVPDISNKNFSQEEKEKFLSISDVFGDYEKRIELELANVTEDNNKVYSESYTKYLHIANLYYHKKDYQNAIENYEKAAKNLKDKNDLAKINYQLARCYMDIGEFDKAFKYSKLSYKQNPEIETELLSGVIFMKSGNNEKAKNIFISILNKNPKTYNAYVYLHQIYYSENNHEAIRTLYELGKNNFPENPPIKYVQNK